MAMSAAELLLSAEPPVDDADIEKALADLDVKIWTWTDAMMSAQAALRNSYAQRPAVYPPMGQFDDADTVPIQGVPAYVPPPPPGNASFAPPSGNEWRPTFVEPSSGAGDPAAAGSTVAWPTGNWPTQPAAPAAPPAANESGWPSAGGGVQWKPASSTPAATTPEWSTWSGAGSPSQAPGEAGSGGASRKPIKQAKGAKAPPAKPIGPTPEELAARAEAEVALLAQLDEATVRRVKLLRRLDPDAPLERLIEKARQAHQPTEAGPKDEKSSWWRRK